MNEPILSLDPDHIATIMDCYHDERIARRGAYEAAYFEAFGELPETTFVIERAYAESNGNVYVHYDRPRLQ